MAAHFLDYLADRVVLCDGAMGTQVQARNLDIDRDFLGKENCTEIVCESRPDLIREIHRGYLAAGCDAIQTNSFGGSPITLGEFGLADRAFALNRLSAEIAREAIAEFAHDGRTRFVLGSVGPGTRLPSLGHVGYQELEDALAVQCGGLIAGGVDAIIIETCQDPLQIKAAVNGAKRAREDAHKDTPILVQVTIETTGSLLVGADIAAAATIVEALGVPMIGLNCATGPREMAEHVKWLGENWPGFISVQPNAGLPELVDGHAQYPLGRRRTRAMARTLCARRRRPYGRRLLRHRCATHRRARCDAPPYRPRPPAPNSAEPPPGMDARARLALRPGGIAPGKRLAVDR